MYGQTRVKLMLESPFEFALNSSDNASIMPRTAYFEPQ